ncbi:hypothetical protein PBCVAN69C_576R [Paramecium bursaria Chlorella virus AN69C]|uniref:Uncharacterized protein n=2 Tax=Chlorovirus TaxID=181083 RepID=Q98582_PBCV1|nr:hypothetical protein PBCV1_A532L [Paramecium bursaria Chlorella virus 1]AAC96899.1 hypothetical protein [Paramecium bursaria Chlorella virus 1]AGE48560.1 hypothetical protein PBCVAN69C_576R [Paramecium bursaria Chlorella virus AN69C]AGE53989.1 hypothetical protein PBCVIL3A_592L [Paramecium bursaria Chlorella virus IL3A]AGE57423.1 hypothetical protein PBCVNEJV4_614L [Paramecium bursaria Chlorella virus NE-JV-4]
MQFVPKSPLVLLLILVAFFVVGMLFGKMFSKGKKAEKFNDAYYGVPSTVAEFAKSPKVLPPVPQNKGVTSCKEWDSPDC